ncbi:hypothetical protein VaNZ11_000770 [Volvox africanus]|uniref:Uncharacterized protein n=1 Tax=Volvox africanus TaxID=51714 RepID=A0ABQ5RPE9_9CHLO|nr:hypothetical protein VaNZ11_000770 [Volvox africanus]
MAVPPLPRSQLPRPSLPPRNPHWRICCARLAAPITGRRNAISRLTPGPTAPSVPPPASPASSSSSFPESCTSINPSSSSSSHCGHRSHARVSGPVDLPFQATSSTCSSRRDSSRATAFPAAITTRRNSW